MPQWRFKRAEIWSSPSNFMVYAFLLYGRLDSACNGTPEQLWSSYLLICVTIPSNTPQVQDQHLSCILNVSEKCVRVCPSFSKISTSRFLSLQTEVVNLRSSVIKFDSDSIGNNSVVAFRLPECTEQKTGEVFSVRNWNVLNLQTPVFFNNFRTFFQKGNRQNLQF